MLSRCCIVRRDMFAHDSRMICFRSFVSSRFVRSRRPCLALVDIRTGNGHCDPVECNLNVAVIDVSGFCKLGMYCFAVAE